ncbi:Translation initiation factor eIF-2B subunit alpha, partial [Galemys pyrenaicus]
TLTDLKNLHSVTVRWTTDSVLFFQPTYDLIAYPSSLTLLVQSVLVSVCGKTQMPGATCLGLEQTDGAGLSWVAGATGHGILASLAPGERHIGTFRLAPLLGSAILEFLMPGELQAIQIFPSPPYTLEEREQHNCSDVNISETKGKGETIQGLRANLTSAIKTLCGVDSSVAVSSGGEIFLRFISLTSLEYSDYSKCKKIMIERGELFSGRISQSRKKIADLCHTFIKDGAEEEDQETDKVKNSVFLVGMFRSSENWLKTKTVTVTGALMIAAISGDVINYSKELIQKGGIKYIAGMGAGGWQASQPPAHLTLLTALLLLLFGQYFRSWCPYDTVHLSPCPTQLWCPVQKQLLADRTISSEQQQLESISPAGTHEPTGAQAASKELLQPLKYTEWPPAAKLRREQFGGFASDGTTKTVPNLAAVIAWQGRGRPGAGCLTELSDCGTTTAAAALLWLTFGSQLSVPSSAQPLSPLASQLGASSSGQLPRVIDFVLLQYSSMWKRVAAYCFLLEDDAVNASLQKLAFSV